METVKCFSCKKSFMTVNKLIRHIRYRHSHTSQITVALGIVIERKNSRLDSYKYHLDTHFKNAKKDMFLPPIDSFSTVNSDQNSDNDTVVSETNDQIYNTDTFLNAKYNFSIKDTDI